MQTATTDTPAAPPPSPGKIDRGALVAELDAMRRSEPAEPAKEAAPPAADPAEPDDAPDAVEAAPDEAAAETPPADAAPEVKDEPLDAATAKRLAAAQKEERQKRERLAAERKQLEDARAALAKEREALAAMQAEAKSKGDPIESIKAKGIRGILELAEQVGLDDDGFDMLAKASYARTKAAASDPKWKAAAEAALREREAHGRLSTTEQKLAEIEKKYEDRIASLEKQIQEREQQSQQRAAIDEYLGTVQKAITPEAAPLVARWAEKSPTKVRQQIHALAAELAETTGEVPDAPTVLAELEQRRRAELEESGIDVSAVLTPAARKAPAAPPPKTLARAGAAPVTPKKKLTPEEERAEFVRRRESGKWDD